MTRTGINATNLHNSLNSVWGRPVWRPPLPLQLHREVAQTHQAWVASIIPAYERMFSFFFKE